MGEEVLTVRGLTARDASGRALVSGIDLTVGAGERVGVVGESGSGKTVLLRCCMGLPPRGVTWDADEATLCGADLRLTRGRALGRLLGSQVGYVPQNTSGYLHPLITVGRQVADAMVARGVPRARARERVRTLLESVGVGDAPRVMASYPDQLSGGQAQRVKVAGALACGPRLVLADEPTAALDAPTQVQVARVLDEECGRRGVAVLLVSHVLGLVREHCDRALVFHAGRVVEQGPASGVFDDPGHPYTRALVAAQPRVGGTGGRLAQVRGVMPSAGRDLPGCGFFGRCPLALPRCAEHVEVARVGSHLVACNRAWDRTAGHGGSASAGGGAR